MHLCAHAAHACSVKGQQAWQVQVCSVCADAGSPPCCRSCRRCWTCSGTTRTIRMQRGLSGLSSGATPEHTAVSCAERIPAFTIAIGEQGFIVILVQAYRHRGHCWPFWCVSATLHVLTRDHIIFACVSTAQCYVCVGPAAIPNIEACADTAVWPSAECASILGWV